MEQTKKITGFLDTLAVGMSLICAVHCLITPLIMILLPIVATTFWADKNFHLWMMLLVIPTTSIAVFHGCKKHKDRAVILLSASGLAVLTGTALYETVKHSGIAENSVHCNMCVSDSAVPLFTIITIVNIIGGALLTSAHVRNFILCRKDNCCHD